MGTIPVFSEVDFDNFIEKNVGKYEKKGKRYFSFYQYFIERVDLPPGVTYSNIMTCELVIKGNCIFEMANTYEIDDELAKRLCVAKELNHKIFNNHLFYIQFELAIGLFGKTCHSAPLTSALLNTIINAYLQYHSNNTK